MKLNCSGENLSNDFSNEFGELLTYSRSLTFDQFPDHDKIKASLTSLAERKGYSSIGPLDWTPGATTAHPTLNEPAVSIPGGDEDGEDDDDDSIDGDSYCGMDIDIWERQGERDKDLTFPLALGATLDGCTSLIAEVKPIKSHVRLPLGRQFLM